MTTTTEFKQLHALTDKRFRGVRDAILAAYPDLSQEDIMVRVGSTAWEMRRLDLWEQFLPTKSEPVTTQETTGDELKIQRFHRDAAIPETAISVELYDVETGSYIAQHTESAKVAQQRFKAFNNQLQAANTALALELRKQELDRKTIERLQDEEHFALVELRERYKMLREAQIKARVRGEQFTGEAELDELAHALGYE